MWRDVLAQVGVAVETVDATHVRLRTGDQQQTVVLRAIPYRVAPSQLPPAPGEPGLLAIAGASAKTIAAATAKGWHVVTDDGSVSLRLGEHSILPPNNDDTADRASRRRGPAPWATFTVVRRLLAAPAATQTELARRASVSQSKVSRVLRNLSDAALVEHTDGQWRPVDWDAAFDWWLAHYPGPAGTKSYWYALDDIATQTRKAIDALDPADSPVISGDAAADLLVPWRRPNRTVIYASAGAPLTERGFVGVASREEATLVLAAPADPGVWLPQPWAVDETLFVADPLQVAYDLASGPESDRTDAVAQLKRALHGRLAKRWMTTVTGDA